MKKIFYASSVFFPSRYANRLQILQTAEALARQLGDNFVLGCNKISDAGRLYTHKHVNFCATRSPILAFKQLRFVLKHGFTVVYSREFTLLFMMHVYNTILFRAPVRYILEVHDMYSDVRFGFVLRRVAHIFCITSGLADDLRLRFNPAAPITILPDAVHPGDFQRHDAKHSLRVEFGLPTDTHIVSYVGSVGVHPWKGVDVFLDSYDKIRNTSVQYVVAGVRDDELEMYRKTYAGKRITFFGWLPRNKAIDIMLLSDILVLPTKSGPRVAERYTSPMKLFEYMASGVPIVASDLPSTREILDETTAFLFSPNDAQALADALGKVISHPEEASARGGRAKDMVQNYSWETRAHVILTTLSL